MMIHNEGKELPMSYLVVSQAAKELVSACGSVSKAAEACGIQRTMLYRICDGDFSRCGLMPRTVLKVRDAYAEKCGKYFSLEEVYR